MVLRPELGSDPPIGSDRDSGRGNFDPYSSSMGIAIMTSSLVS